MSHNARWHASFLRASALLVLLMVVVRSKGQGVHQWTERENLGFKGPVRSARTSVARPNADPRLSAPHKLFVEGHPDWEVFDLAGRRIEFVSSSSGDVIVSVSKCTFEAEDAKLCEDSKAQRQESREKRTTLPDGSREVKHLRNAAVESREVTQFDEEGKAASLSVYGSSGKLNTKYMTLPDGERWQIFDDNGVVTSDMRTRSSDDGNRIERWFYDSDGRLVWNLTISSNGELLSHWYEVGFREKLSTSDSLGTCRHELCVDYKFDTQGTGRLEKIVQHFQGAGYLEPVSEEHYNLDDVLDEKAEIKYTRDEHGNWTARSVLVWDLSSNVPVEIERDTRSIDYYH